MHSKTSQKNRNWWTALLGACIMAVVGCGGTEPGPGPGGTGPGGTGPGVPTGCAFGCQRGFLCQGSSCTLDPTGRWVLRVTSGTVSMRDNSGADWDTFSGPDAKVCMTLNGSRSCTRAAGDTYSPVWNADFPAATATALQSGVVIEYLEDDTPDSDDPICSGPLAVSASSFASGVWGFTCESNTSKVSIQLTAQ